MADAYAYADGGPPSREILLAQYIDRYGCEAVLGRKLYAREIYRINITETIVNAYRDRAQYEWGAWARQHPELDKLLNQALMAKQERYGDD